MIETNHKIKKKSTNLCSKLIIKYFEGNILIHILEDF